MDKTYTGRCMKCKENDREMRNVEIVTMKNGAKAAKGKCSVCGGGMYRILPKDAA